MPEKHPVLPVRFVGDDKPAVEPGTRIVVVHASNPAIDGYAAVVTENDQNAPGVHCGITVLNPIGAGEPTIGVTAWIDPDDALAASDLLCEFAADCTGFAGMDIDEDGATVKTRPLHSITERFAAFLAEWLDFRGAENYTETVAELSTSTPDQEASVSPAGTFGAYTITVCRAGGKTPHELRREAEKRADALQTELDELRAQRMICRSIVAEQGGRLRGVCTCGSRCSCPATDAGRAMADAWHLKHTTPGVD